MSLVKTGAVQVGQSATASNNFHWRNLLDGVLRLTRGNAGAPITDVMLVKADNSVEFPGGVSGGVLGAGQTWQDVTGSRAANTTYTNSTGKPILVWVGFAVVAGGTISYLINGVIVAYNATIDVGDTVPVSFIVPNGATYRCNTTSALNRWSELR